MLKKFILSAAIAVASAAPALAGNLQVDAASSVLEFTAIGKPGFLRINGHGAKVEGTAEQGKDNISGTFESRLDDFQTGIDTRDEHMKKKYLETAKYPKAVLKWSVPLAKIDSAREVPFDGTLTLHGVEKKISGKAKVEPADGGKQIKVDATFPLKLSDFKIDIPSYLGVTVAEDVDVHAAFTAAGH